MVVRGSRPDVSLVVAKVHPQPPSGQVERVAARGRYIVGHDAVPLQLAQVRCIELHRAYVMRAVRIANPLARLAAFLFGDRQHDVGGHFILHGGRDRAHDAFLLQWWQVRNEREHDYAVPRLANWVSRLANAAISAASSASLVPAPARLLLSNVGAESAVAPIPSGAFPTLIAAAILPPEVSAMRSIAASLAPAIASFATCAVPFAKFAAASAAISPTFPAKDIRPPELCCWPPSGVRVLPDPALS